jgi:hypothetical protein
MLYTIALVLLIMWLLTLVSGFALTASVHVLLAIAIVVCLTGLILGQRPAL